MPLNTQDALKIDAALKRNAYQFNAIRMSRYIPLIRGFGLKTAVLRACPFLLLLWRAMALYGCKILR
ncbi:MAG: hypothetical protein AB8C95_09590, partial [Phycisphaeraceae bacterium]